MCVSPLVRFRLKYKPSLEDVRKCPLFSDEVFDVKKKGFKIVSKKKLESFFDNHGQYLLYMNALCDYIELPCGRCIECKKNYARDWSIRCYHESLYHDMNCFLTLTVSDDGVNSFEDRLKSSFDGTSNFVCKSCNNGSNYYRYPINYSLNKGLIKDFIKRLRDYLYRHYSITIRYFLCGEYGSKFERPHYHCLLFGYNFPVISKDNKIIYNRVKDINSSAGVPMFISEELNKLWPYGMARVQDLNFNACMYTAKYCMKKVKFFDSEDLFDYYYGKNSEFLLMSRGNCQSNRCKFVDNIIADNLNSLKNFTNKYCKLCNKSRGGLGFQWICDYYQDVYKLGYIVIDGKKYPIPKYYMNLINLTNEKMYDKIRTDNIYYVDERLERYPDEKSSERNEVRRRILLNKSNLYDYRECSND